MSPPDATKDRAVSAPPALRVAWWNTGLSPPGQRSNDDRRRWRLTVDIVHGLLEDADVLVLGEINGDDLFGLCPTDAESLPVQGVNPSNIGVLFAPRRVILGDPGALSFKARGKQLRVLQLGVQHADVHRRIDVLAVHFHSHIREQHEELRRVFASDLSREISRLRRQGEEDASLVVIGDFNDEPFSEALRSRLRGVRERVMVHADRERELLYNPFWRKLGERSSAGDGAPSFGPAGTHYYGNDAAVTGERWFTYDQFLVTGAFLRGAGWTLDDEYTDIVCPPSLLSKHSLKYGIDHLPIVGKFSYLPEKDASQ